MVKEMIQALNLKQSKSSFCNYSDACIIVTGDTTAAGGDGNTKVAFKNLKDV